MSDWDNYESGPFCPHYGDPMECEEICKCGHACGKHYTECSVGDCKCEKFEDKDEDA